MQRPMCQTYNCSNPATCYGRYEDAEESSYACDDCCGHGCEDGRCAQLCAYCDKPSEGDFTIHRDGFGEGPEVYLCNACGGNYTPTPEEIWERIRERREADGKGRRA